MSKRFLSILLAALILAACIPFAAFADNEDNSAPPGEGYYYVYTENGKSLNVRTTPGGTVVGSLKYGTRIHVHAVIDNGSWALITYHYDQPGYGPGDYAAYVSTRFLTKSKPAARTATKTTTTAAAVDPLAEINAEFRSAVTVEPYMVTVRPTRTSGWVNMRWAPTKSAELIATYRANAQLLVLKETTNWLQVEDQDTGDVGFINKAFIAK